MSLVAVTSKYNFYTECETETHREQQEL